MQLVNDGKTLLKRLMGHHAGFYLAAAYLFFEYFRPQVIYTWIDVLPWARIIILSGFFYVIAKGHVKLQGMHWLLFTFMCLVFVSTYFSFDRIASLNTIDYIISWVVIVVFFTAAVRNLEQYKVLLILLFIFLFKMSFFGARTWATRGFGFADWGISGPKGFFQNSGELSLLMVVFTAMSLGFILGHKNVNKIYYLVPITAAMTVLASSTRGSQLALAVVAVLFLLCYGKLRIKYILAFSVIAWIGFALLPEEQKDRFRDMGQDDTSESRLTYWEKGWEMMNNHKLVGVGYYAFPSYFEHHYAPYIQFENFTYRREVAHNSFIQVGSEMGYPGLIVYLLLLWQCYKLNKKSQKYANANPNNASISWVPSYCTGQNIALAGYVVGSLFMSVAFYPYLYLFLMLAASLHQVITPHNKAPEIGAAYIKGPTNVPQN